MRIQMSQKAIKYCKIRIDQLNEEYQKNPSEENSLIFEKAIAELYILLDLLKREQSLSIEPYKGIDDPHYVDLP